MSEFNHRIDRWYKASVHVDSKTKFHEIILWIETNVDGWKKHVDYRMSGDKRLDLRFRHEKDCEWFILRWG